MATLQEVMDQIRRTNKLVRGAEKGVAGPADKKIVHPRKVADPKKQQVLQDVLSDQEDVRRIESLKSFKDATTSLTPDLSREVVGDRSLGEEIITIEKRRAKRADTRLRKKFPDIVKLDKAWQRFQKKRKDLPPAVVEMVLDFFLDREDEIVDSINKSRSGINVIVSRNAQSRRIFSDVTPVQDVVLVE